MECKKASTVFLRNLIEVVPYKIRAILTGNGAPFCHLPRYRTGAAAQYITPMFDICCNEHRIERRLTETLQRPHAL